MQKFSLQGKEFIELNKLLKFKNLVSSGGEANQVIVAEEVLVNQEIETQKRKKLRAGDVVEFDGKEILIEE